MEMGRLSFGQLISLALDGHDLQDDRLLDILDHVDRFDSLPMSCPSTTPKYRKPSSSKKIVGRYSRLSRVLSQRSQRPTRGDSRTRRYHAVSYTHLKLPTNRA